MLPTLFMSSAIKILQCYMNDGVARSLEVMCTSQGLIPRAHTGSYYLVNHASKPCPRRLPMRCSDGARERPSEHQMMICLAEP